MRVRVTQEFESCLSRILENTSQKLVPYFQPLEKGPAYKAGVTACILQLSVTSKIALFSIPDGSDTPVKQDIVAHAASAEVSAMILITPEGERAIFSEDVADAYAWLKEICLPGNLSAHHSHSEIQISLTDPTEGIIQYLTELRKELNSWLYRKDGETSESVRELTIQTLINRILLTRIFLAHDISDPSGTDITLRDALCSFASTVPVQDIYDIQTRVPDEETTQLVYRLASAPVRVLQDIRISWITPECWAAAFACYFSGLHRKKRLKKSFYEEEEENREIQVHGSGAGTLISGILEREGTHLLSGKIWDPASGTGELIALVLRLLRMDLIRSGRSDSIISRLITAGEKIHATEASPSRIVVTRFVISCWIISSDLDDPSLTGTPLWYPFFSLTRQIRAGSPLYDERTLEEFSSVHEGYPVLRHLHPLSPKALTPEIRPFSLILSCPCGQSPGGPPEVASYLTRRFISYTKGVSRGALFGEMASECIAPGGICIIFLEKNWLSESTYQGFRRWVADIPPITIFVPEDGPYLDYQEDLTAVIYHPGIEKVHTAVRFRPREGETGFQIRKYHIIPAEQPRDDGWRLQDPWEQEMMRRLHKGTIPLTEYLFDELYPGSEGGRLIHSSGFWISLLWNELELSAHSGLNPRPDAVTIIPGQDPYLITLLHSSLIRWYVKTTMRSGQNLFSDPASLIRNLPIRVIDPYSEEDQQALTALEMIRSRLDMLIRKKEISHTWHDISRIQQQITKSQIDLDHWIGILYGLSSEECGVFRQRLDTTEPMI
ncbi:MAG: hypothetical protein LUQ50_02575 [Methanospirillum sp.]|uniref:hypothetical protein n=1 Tax=Methanospirillum sp. TaxID=45200 RepID=UPI002375D940|nr:hypothetical protein [Methanospirillum sp.]MDD1727939.1 hypothetical protein [Methanospirillum sp.]